MDYCVEKAKELVRRNSRYKKLFFGALGYLGLALLLVHLGNQNPIMQIVVIPLTVGVAVGILLASFSVGLNFETTIKLIDMEQKLDELGRKLSDVKQQPSS